MSWEFKQADPSEEDLLCAQAFNHSLLYVGSVCPVNGGRTPECVPDEAEAVAAGS